MATIKLQSGAVVLKDGKVSCGCCGCCGWNPPGIWAFSTSIGSSDCPEKCSELMALWEDGLVGWGNSVCSPSLGSDTNFVVANNSSTQGLQINIVARPNMTLVLETFEIDGISIEGSEGSNISFVIPVGCSTPTDISQKFTAYYTCNCTNTTRCRGGWVAEAPTYSYITAT
jgi:hypothetical protein